MTGRTVPGACALLRSLNSSTVAGTVIKIFDEVVVPRVGAQV